MTRKALVAKSKELSYLLRHAPEKYGVSMANDGSVKISEVLEALEIGEPVFREIVESDSKQRFIVSGDFVFAAQGHSLDVTVPMAIFEGCESLYHGTNSTVIDAILVEGLRPGGRNFVHLSKNIETAVSVANRRKAGEVVLLEVDVVALRGSGIVVWEAVNGVVLAEFVSPEFLKVL